MDTPSDLRQYQIDYDLDRLRPRNPCDSFFPMSSRPESLCETCLYEEEPHIERKRAIEKELAEEKAYWAAQPPLEREGA